MVRRDVCRRVLRSLVAALAMLATLHGLSAMSCPHAGAATHAASGDERPTPTPAAAHAQTHTHGGASHAAMSHGGGASAQATMPGGDEGNPMPGCHCPGACVCTPLVVAAFVAREAWIATPVHRTATPLIAIVVPATRTTWLLPPATAPPVFLAAA